MFLVLADIRPILFNSKLRKAESNWLKFYPLTYRSSLFIVQCFFTSKKGDTATLIAVLFLI